MTKEDAIRQIILDYCDEHHLMPVEFARKSEISKSYISKIINRKYGSVGISLTYLSLIAKGLDMKTVDLQILIEKYQSNANEEELRRTKLIIDITNKVESYSGKDLEVLHSIILNTNSERLEILHSLLKNMK